MKRLGIIALGILGVIGAVGPQTAGASVVTYPAPSGGIPLSPDFTVTAEGQAVDVYRVIVPPRFVGYQPCPATHENASMAYFDFSGTVSVRITSRVAISSVVIRPLRHNIQPTISGNVITFSLSQPRNLSIEINGDDRHNLHLFANPMEVNVPSPSDPNVVYYGPGVHGDGGIIAPGNGKTIYVAGGAVVFGSFYPGGNTTIRGRGIISGERTPKQVCTNEGGTVMIYINGQGGAVTLEGFIALDPSSWTMGIQDVSNLNVDNIKVIAWRGNSDGLDLLSVSQGTIKNIFIRNTDDTFCTKSDPYYILPADGRATENITWQDSVAWGDGAGHVLEFAEQTTPYVRNITMKNIDVIHSYVPVIEFGCCAAYGEIYNVNFDDIRVEDMQGPHVFEFTAYNNWIHDIGIKNFNLMGGNVVPSVLFGSDSNLRVSNITFTNLKYLGQTILNAAAGQFQIGSNTANIKFLSGTTLTPSPDKTEIPPATQIVDNSNNVWTLGSGAGTYKPVLMNGSQTGEAFGRDLYWFNGSIYLLGDDEKWYLWNGSWTIYGPTKPGGLATSACDVNGDGATNVTDVQLMVNQAIRSAPCTTDINQDDSCDVLDVQRVVNAVLSGQCLTP